MDMLEILFGSGRDLTALQMCDRAVVVFLLTLMAVRIAGRRSLGQHNAFDFIVAVLLGAVASRAIVGVSPFIPTMAACFTIVILHRVMGWLSVRLPVLDRLINGRERVLVQGGRRDLEEMKRALITPHDLEEAARLHGETSSKVYTRILLERNGQISLLK